MLTVFGEAILGCVCFLVGCFSMAILLAHVEDGRDRQRKEKLQSAEPEKVEK